MTLLKTTDPDLLTSFPKRPEQLAIVQRQPLPNSSTFFAQVIKHPLKVATLISRKNADSEISQLLADIIPTSLQTEATYHAWINDMAEVCRLFADILKTDRVSFWIGTQRGCRLYHVDNIPFRLLVTYAGQGTEWVPEAATDRAALLRGDRGEDLITDTSALQYMNPFDIALFRGGPQGLLHRTPETALKAPSLMMRLDHPSFWENVIRPAA